jgi:hypothetical protein
MITRRRKPIKPLQTRIHHNGAGRIKPIEKQTREERVAAIAGFLDRSEITIRTWIREGLDVWDVDQVCLWAQFKQSRQRNRRRPDSIPRRIRSPL